MFYIGCGMLIAILREYLEEDKESLEMFMFFIGALCCLLVILIVLVLGWVSTIDDRLITLEKKTAEIQEYYRSDA